MVASGEKRARSRVFLTRCPAYVMTELSPGNFTRASFRADGRKQHTQQHLIVMLGRSMYFGVCAVCVSVCVCVYVCVCVCVYLSGAHPASDSPRTVSGLRPESRQLPLSLRNSEYPTTLLIDPLNL